MGTGGGFLGPATGTWDPNLLSVPSPAGAMVTSLPPLRSLGTYLVVGEGEGAGERGCRAIWAPRKMVLEQHRSEFKAGPLSERSR